MPLTPIHLNSFTRTFLAFFLAFTVPVSALALYMGHIGEIAGYKVDKPGNQLPMAAALRVVPDISIFGQSQGAGGITRVHITSKQSMGFHTLYVLPDNQTVIAGVPLTGPAGGEITLAELTQDLDSYQHTLKFLSAQYRHDKEPEAASTTSSTGQRLTHTTQD